MRWEAASVHMHPLIEAKHDEIAAACQRYGVARLHVFGSAARSDDFDPATSDADFLVEFSPRQAVDHYLDLKESFERILDRPIDLVDRRAIEASRNYIRRKHILSQAQAVYEA